MKFGREFFTENSQTSMSSVKIGSVTVILRVGADEFLHFFPYFYIDFREIRYIRSPHNAVAFYEFQENGAVKSNVYPGALINSYP